MLVRLLLLAVEAMTSLSRIIRSVHVQPQEDEAREIKIQRIFEEQALPEMSEGESLTLADVYHERDKLLAEARATLHQEQEALTEERMQLLEEVEQLRQAWEEERPQHVQQAYEEGFAQGYEEGMHKAEAAMQEALTQANQVVSHAQSNASAYVEAQEQVILSLALEVAEHIMGTSLAQDENYFVPLVKRALKEAREMKEIKIYVAPKYYEVVTEKRDELAEMFPPDVPLLIFVIEEFEDTECYIETNHGRIVVTIDEQLQALRNKLFELLSRKE